MQRIDIALACDERYFPGLLSTVSSLLTNASANYIYAFHILDGGINESSIAVFKQKLERFAHTLEITFIPIDTASFEDFPAFFYDSKMAYARLLLPSLLSVNKVIYIDTDILVLKDISVLWQYKLSNHAGVCIESIVGSIKNDCPLYKELGLNGDAPYFNSGLMLIDLHRFREDKIAIKTADYLKEYSGYCKYWDQSALNVILYNKVDWLDDSWNVQAHKEVYNPVTDLKLLQSFSLNFHFVTSNKPWLSYSNHPEYRMFYALLEEIDFHLEDKNFLKSQSLYYRRMFVVKLLPLYYSAKAFFYNTSGKPAKAKMFTNISDYWRYEKDINKSLHRKEQEISELIGVWRDKIQTKLLSR